MSRKTDYERVAPTYDRRYAGKTYDGVAAYLLEWIDPSPRLRVLELGCGTGHWLEILAEAGCHPTGLDPSPSMLAKAREAGHGTLTLGSAEAIPLADARFDRVYCVNAFHHFTDKPAALREAKRVLAPGGRFLTIALDPHEGSDRWFLYDYFEGTLDIDRTRYASCPWIRSEMEATGFQDCRSEVAEHLAVDAEAETALDAGRVDKRTTSQLAVLTDEEYARGLRAIRADVAAARARGEELRLSLDLRLWATMGTTA